MKNLIIHITVLLLLLASCRHQADDSCLMNKDEASPYDSVFQDVAELTASQPDSALSLLAAFSDTLDTEKMSLPDYYEYQILVAEALYKNDYLQTNDSAVNEAVKYYDSLTALYPGDLDLQYKKARAYYYKGVGDTEKDDIVEACKDYLKALEVMESELNEDELDFEKRKFIGLTFFRLAELYYSEYAISIAKTLYNNAYKYELLNNDSIGIIGTLIGIGRICDDEKNIDSAIIYYEEAISMIDTNVYQHIYYMYNGDLAILHYNNGEKNKGRMLMCNTINSMESNDYDAMSLYCTYGEMLVSNKEYDKAKPFFEKSIEYNNRFVKNAAAEHLAEIHRIKGNIDSADYYTRLSMPYINRERNKAVDKNNIIELYNNYETEMLLFQHDKRRNKIQAVTTIVFLVIIVIAGLICAAVFVRRAREHERLIESKDHAIELKDKSIDELRNYYDDLEKHQKAHGNFESFEQRLQIFKESAIYNKIKSSLPSGDDRIVLKTIDDYPELVLEKNDFMLLQETINNTFDDFVIRLSRQYPELTRNQKKYCCLIIMGITISEMAALSGVKYNAVNNQMSKIKEIVGTEKDLDVFFMEMLMTDGF